MKNKIKKKTHGWHRPARKQHTERERERDGEKKNAPSPFSFDEVPTEGKVSQLKTKKCVHRKRNDEEREGGR